MSKNVLFLTGCYPKEFNDYYVNNSKVMPQNAANVLSWRIIEGLVANIPNNFKVLTCPFIGYFPKGFTKLFIKDAKWKVGEVVNDQLGFINIKGLETFIKSERIYRYVRIWYKESENNRAMLIYSHYAGFLRVAGKIKKKMPDMHLSCLVTDMPEISNSYEERTLVEKIKSVPRKIMFGTTYKNLEYIDSFVLLAEKMKEYLGVGRRPYCVVEGICESSIDFSNIKAVEKPENEFRVVYTGTLHKQYGVVTLANAFNQISDKNIVLYICGSGDGEEEVRTISETNPCVKFLGVVPHRQAIELQKSADLLVNPRPAEGLYTELSFPSKTMEYMVMGKPVICYKLRGIPDEYDDYLMYFEDFTAEKIAQKILEVSRFSTDKIKEISAANRDFVLKHKCPKVQVEKIINILEEN